MKNQQVRLAGRPSGWVSLDDFELADSEAATPADGEVLLRNIYLSVDPYMRGRMNDVKSYIAPFKLGEVLQGGVVAEVVESRYEGLEPGDFVLGMLGWEQYSCCDGRLLRKIPAADVPLSWYLGVLGMPGMTAYVGLMKIAAAKPGDTVFVSAASGAVGSIVGQLAKMHGCRVAGCAGSDRKVALLRDEYGYDAAFNYKSSESLPASVHEVCPRGIDVLFENVGGPIFEAALWHMRDFGRIALCGMIAEYNEEKPKPGPRGMMLMVARRLRMEGFIVSDHPKFCDEYLRQAVPWASAGKLNYREHITEGLANAPQAFIDLLKGTHAGKQVVRLADAGTATP